MNIRIRNNVFNQKFLPYLYCETPVQIFYGSGGSGKSVFLFQRDIISCVMQPRNFLIIRAVANTIRSSCFEEAKKAISQFRLGQVFKVNESEMTIRYTPRGNLMYFRGLDDVEKLKSITVPIMADGRMGVITDLHIEEATEIAEQDYDQLDIRLRGLTIVPKRNTFSFNPVYRSHWIAKRFFGGQNIKHHHDADLLIHHSTHWDNRFLTEADHKKYESKTGYFHDVYAKGEWGVLGNTIFTTWRVADLSQYRGTSQNWRHGLDFGFTNDPTAYIKTFKKDNTIFIVDEIYARGYTNSDIARHVKPLSGKDTIYCDAAEAKSIVELNTLGLCSYPVKKGGGSVLHGIQWLQQHEIVIDKSCVNTINEFSMAEWKKDKDGNTINQPVDKDNHAIDALRYAYESDMLGGGKMLY